MAALSWARPPTAQRRPALLWGPRGMAGRCVLPSQVRVARGARPPSARRKGLRVHGHPPRSRAATPPGPGRPGPGRSGPGRSGPGLLGLFLRQPLAVPALPRWALPREGLSSHPRAATLRWPGVGSARTSTPYAPRPRALGERPSTTHKGGFSQPQAMISKGA